MNGANQTRDPGGYTRQVNRGTKPEPSLVPARKDVLNGWKEIAQYISRDIRTVERWEKQRGLPVRRIPGAGRGVVYARVSELEQWLAGHTSEGVKTQDLTPSRVEPAEVAVIASSAPEASAARGLSLVKKEGLEPVAETLPVSLVRPGATRWKLAATSLTATLLCFGLASIHWLHSAPVKQAAGVAGLYPREHQHSRVAGVNELYLRGAFALEQRTPESLERARITFTDAISGDPDFAPAYAGLAETYCLLREYAHMPDAQAWPAAKSNAEKAVSLDPQLSEGHAVLGFVDFFWDVDAASADREFQTAIRLNPGSALGHHWYGSMLTHDGRFAEALQQLDAAQTLQPGSTAILTQRALAMGLGGRRDEAEAMLKENLKQNLDVGDHDSSTAHIVLAILSLQPPADLHQALTEYQRSAELRHDGRSVERQTRLLRALESSGAAGVWRTQIALEREEHPGGVTFATVEAEAQLGDREQAIRDLRTILARPNNGAFILNTDALLNPLRSEAAFAELPGVHVVALPAEMSASNRVPSAQ